MCRYGKSQGLCKRSVQRHIRLPERNTELRKWRLLPMHGNHDGVQGWEHTSNVQQRLLGHLRVPERIPDLLWRRVCALYECISSNLQRWGDSQVLRVKQHLGYTDVHCTHPQLRERHLRPVSELVRPNLRRFIGTNLFGWRANADCLFRRHTRMLRSVGHDSCRMFGVQREYSTRVPCGWPHVTHMRQWIKRRQTLQQPRPHQTRLPQRSLRPVQRQLTGYMPFERHAKRV